MKPGEPRSAPLVLPARRGGRSCSQSVSAMLRSRTHSKLPQGFKRNLRSSSTKRFRRTWAPRSHRTPLRRTWAPRLHGYLSKPLCALQGQAPPKAKAVIAALLTTRSEVSVGCCKVTSVSEERMTVAVHAVRSFSADDDITWPNLTWHDLTRPDLTWPEPDPTADLSRPDPTWPKQMILKLWPWNDVPDQNLSL